MAPRNPGLSLSRGTWFPSPGETRARDGPRGPLCVWGAGGGGKGVATGSWLSGQPHRAPSAPQAGRAGALGCDGGGGRCTRGGVPTFSTVHRSSSSSSFGARWWQRGSLPPGRAGWVAVGVGSQAGLLPTLPPAPSPASFPIWGLEAWGPTSQLQGAPLRGCRVPKASGGFGSGRPMAFALSGEQALQTPRLLPDPARPKAAPRDPASLAPRVLASPGSCLPGWASGRG